MCKACTHASTVQVLRLAAQATDGSPLSALGMLGKTHGVPAPGTAAAGAAAPHSSSPARVAAAPAGTGGAARPLLLTVQRAVLSSWVVELQAVQALHLVVRGELVSGGAPGGAHGGSHGARAPLMLRSATQRKRGATLELNLSAMLVGEASDATRHAMIPKRSSSSPKFAGLFEYTVSTACHNMGVYQKR